MTGTIEKTSDSQIRVFTQLCKRANFSISGKTMTIYPKLQGVTVPNEDNRINEALKPINDAWKFLGNKVEIREFHSNHELFHKDNFSRKNWHTHIEFEEELNEDKLKQILQQFVISKLITEEEENQFILAYRQANQMSQADYDIAIATMYLANLKKSVNRLYSSQEKLKKQADEVITQFELLLESRNDIRQLQNYIRETQLVIEHPTKDNIDKLHEMGMTAEGHSSLLWKILGASLMLLGAAMVAASIIMVAGTGTLGIAPGVGLALGGLGLFAAGAVSFNHGLQKGLSKNLTTLSDSINETLDSEEKLAYSRA